MWDNERKEPKYRNPDPARGETRGMVEIDGRWYGLGSNEPQYVRNERYDSSDCCPACGDPWHGPSMC